MAVGSVIRELARRRPAAVVAVGVVVQAASAVFIRTTDTTGLVLSFWRFWISVPVLLLLAWPELHAPAVPVTAASWRWSAVAGLAFAGHQLCFLVALQRTSIVDVTLMQVLQPVLVGLAAARLFGERPGLSFRLWSGVGMLGAAVVILNGAAGPEGDPLGMLLAFGNVVFFVAYFLISKHARSSIGVLPFLWVTSTTGAVVITAMAVAAAAPVGSIDGHGLLVAVTIALGGGIVGHVLITWPLAHLPANVPPLLQLAFPFVAGALAWLLLGEGISWLHLVGGAVTIVGVVGALRSRARSTTGDGVVLGTGEVVAP